MGAGVSFIPDRPQRELRELVRYRRSLVQERSREVSRLQKVLEGANLKLGSVASDVFGVSGRDMLQAIIQGTEDPVALAALARGCLKQKTELLRQALRGLVGAPSALPAARAAISHRGAGSPHQPLEHRDRSSTGPF
jgi:hypothetical protein